MESSNQRRECWRGKFVLSEANDDDDMSSTFVFPTKLDQMSVVVQNYDALLKDRCIVATVAITIPESAGGYSNAFVMGSPSDPTKLSSTLICPATTHFIAAWFPNNTTLVNIYFQDPNDPSLAIAGYTGTVGQCMTVDSNGRAVFTVPVVASYMMGTCIWKNPAFKAGTGSKSLAVTPLAVTGNLQTLTDLNGLLLSVNLSAKPGTWFSKLLAGGAYSSSTGKFALTAYNDADFTAAAGSTSQQVAIFTAYTETLSYNAVTGFPVTAANLTAGQLGTSVLTRSGVNAACSPKIKDNFIMIVTAAACVVVALIVGIVSAIVAAVRRRKSGNSSRVPASRPNSSIMAPMTARPSYGALA